MSVRLYPARSFWRVASGTVCLPYGRRLLPSLFWLLCGLVIGSAENVSAAVDYLRDIKPLLTRECVKCHGATQQKGGLRLDTASAAVQGGKHGALWRPGDSSASLLMQVLENQHPEISRMPYKRAPLDSSAMALIRGWIQAGAVYPAQEEPGSDQHWAFQTPRRPSVPRGFPSPIDAFIQQRLATDAIQPSTEADSETLLRRVFLDLIGLPPTLAERDLFLADRAPGAYERLVDRLLASPHYGERWGRWWLDAARYADSNGYSVDLPRSIWPFRDWVVRAFNSDMPFDRFTLLQIAGDLLQKEELPPGVDPNDALVATGFHRNTQINHEGGVDAEQFRIESVVDRVSTTATVWFGLTLACAQCHDHKFDPFTQRDYYRFFAYFNSTENDGHATAANEALNVLELATPAEKAERDALQASQALEDADVESWASQALRMRQTAWESALQPPAKAKFTQLLQEALSTPGPLRSVEASNRVWAAFRDQHPEFRTRRQTLLGQRKALPKLTTSLVMKELPRPRETWIFLKGDFTRPGERVEPGTPAVLPASPSPSSPNRLGLARWITAPENPLVARVFVNRVWLQLFGRGLVETENDFGSQGALPSHPELLDWLAIEFVRTGWSLKRLQRILVTSATYRRSSKERGDLVDRDPANRLLARQSRLRLDAELIRDQMLEASGLLDRRMGGPPVFPPQPAGLGAFTQADRPWVVSKGSDRYRRALYTHLQRSTLHPALTVFDAPDAFQSCTRRLRSNTPLQALTLLNDPAFTEFAQSLGRRLAASEGLSDSQRIELGFQICLARSPTRIEEDRFLAFLAAERAQVPDPGQGVWTRVGRVLLNLDELITRE